MIIEYTVWHTVVKVHKNNYVSFCYKLFGSTAVKSMAGIILKCACRHTKLMCLLDSSDFEMLQLAYKVSVFYWDKLGDSENSRFILEVVYISTVSGLHKST